MALSLGSRDKAGRREEQGREGTHLELAAAEHGLVEEDGVGDEGRVGKLDVGVPVRGPPDDDSESVSALHEGERETQREGERAHPLGPVNLSNRIVTRLMVPHDAKCCWISSGVEL